MIKNHNTDKFQEELKKITSTLAPKLFKEKNYYSLVSFCCAVVVKYSNEVDRIENGLILGKIQEAIPIIVIYLQEIGVIDERLKQSLLSDRAVMMREEEAIIHSNITFAPNLIIKSPNRHATYHKTRLKIF